jgi:L-lactate dehydrogenase complex protein LldG
MAKVAEAKMTTNPVVQQAANASADILRSIRAHLNESARTVAANGRPGVQEMEASMAIAPSPLNSDERSLIEIFRKQLESVGAHCILVANESQLPIVLERLLAELRSNGIPASRIALSDASLLRRLEETMAGDGNELSILPAATDLFGYDVGLTTAQAAIAETGTLVLDSDRERHRLVSLVPPVHIAIIDARNIRATLGEAITQLQRDSHISPAITFITGPSRTADIELTLTIGVHGPKELYVIINEDSVEQVGNS